MKSSIRFLLIIFLFFQINTSFGQGPKRLFDLGFIKKQSLFELQWKQTERIFGKNGETIIRGSWTFDTWKYTTPDGKKVPCSIRYNAVIVMPPVNVVNQNNIGLVAADRSYKEADFIDECMSLGVPVLLHQQSPIDWERLGLRKRSDLIVYSFDAIQNNNRQDSADFVNGNFFWAMSYMNMSAITLLEHLCEREGRTVSKVALAGNSKEAMSVWLAASVDDRIAAIAPGGFQYFDFKESLYEIEKTGNWDNNKEMRQFLYWVTESKAGAAWLRTFDLKYYNDELIPEIFVIKGSVGMYDMHDGQHFRLGLENSFLSKTDREKWRYIRKAEKGQETSSNELMAVLYLNNYHLPFMTKQSVNVGADGKIKFLTEYSGEVDHAYLWWNISDDDQWNDKDQEEWKVIPMKIDNQSKTASVNLLLPRDKHYFAFYMEIESEITIDENKVLLEDAGAVRIRKLKKNQR